MNNQKSLKIIKKDRRVHVKAMNNVRKNYQQVENVLTNYAPSRKYIKRFVLEYSRINIVFFVKIVMKTITTIYIANFVSKYTQTITKMRMMISGLVVIAVRDG